MNLNFTFRAAWIAVLAMPMLASASPRVVLGPIKGDRGGLVSRQLSSAVCGQLQCAPRSSAYVGARPDFARARRQGVSGILYGAVTGTGARRQLWLALLTRSARPTQTWKLPLRGKGVLASAAVDEIVRDTESRLSPTPAAPPRVASPAAPAPALPPVEPAPSFADSRAVPLPPPAAQPYPGAPAEPSDGLAPEPHPAATRAATAAEPSGARPTRLAAELGGYVTGRELSFSGTQPAGTATLQTMSAAAVFCPRLALEVYPGAFVTDGLLAGLGVYGDYRTSVGFKVQSANRTYGTSLSRVGAGVVWRLPPLTRLELVLAPRLSWERRDVKVSGTIPGLADTHLQGVRVGAGLTVPFASRFAVLVGGGYVRWTKAGDLAQTGGRFFPSGTAAALEVEAGLAVHVAGPFSARLTGEYSSTRYALDPDPSGSYRATGATDRWAGGTISVRAEL